MFKAIKEMLTKERTYTAVDAITLIVFVSGAVAFLKIFTILW